jgi:hypothetical protein
MMTPEQREHVMSKPTTHVPAVLQYWLITNDRADAGVLCIGADPATLLAIFERLHMAGFGLSVITEREAQARPELCTEAFTPESMELTYALLGIFADYPPLVIKWPGLHRVFPEPAGAGNGGARPGARSGKQGAQAPGANRPGEAPAGHGSRHGQSQSPDADCGRAPAASLTNRRDVRAAAWGIAGGLLTVLALAAITALVSASASMAWHAASRLF